jgi:hypothetical protein
MRGTIDTLEISRGSDGALRGDPEPVLLFGWYAAGGDLVRPVGRSHHRFRVDGPFPTCAHTDEPVLPDVALTSQIPFRFVILAIAIEEDGGEDVQRLYGALDRPTALATWHRNGADLEPLSLAALPSTPAWGVPAPVELLCDSNLASESSSDKFIGAVAWALTPRLPRSWSTYRLPFLSSDGKNDWTAVLTLRH